MKEVRSVVVKSAALMPVRLTVDSTVWVVAVGDGEGEEGVGVGKGVGEEEAAGHVFVPLEPRHVVDFQDCDEHALVSHARELHAQPPVFCESPDAISAPSPPAPLLETVVAVV